MQSFKLKNKGEEQKILEQQIKDTQEKSLKPNLNIIQKNPQTTGAVFLGIIAILIAFIKSGGLFSIIIVIFAARRLLRAKKIGENKKYIRFSYIIVYLPVFFWILNSIYFTIYMLENVK